MRLLLAEDELKLNGIIKKALEASGYAVDAVADGQSALEYLESTHYDAAVLDVMMPLLDGFEVVRRYRASGGECPVLFLTARDAVADRVTGLDSGGDDYLVKPFSFDELFARLRVLIRRTASNSGKASNILSVGTLSLDRASMKVKRGDRDIELSSKEFAILEYLMLNAGSVLTRESIRSHVWTYDYEGESNMVDVYIRFLRKKIDDDENVKLIHTVRGAGYCLKEE